MTDNITVSRELLRQAIEALNEAGNVLTSSMFAEAADALRAALDAPVQEPSHDVVAGAIFDFAGFLTSHKVMIEVGSCSNASPMVERIKEWSGNRGLSLENPDVFGWQMRTAQPRKAVKLSDSEILAALEVEYVSSAQNRHLFLSDARTIEAAVWAKLGVEP